MAAKHVPLLEVVTKVMASRSVVHPCGGSPVRTPISILRVLLSTRNKIFYKKGVRKKSFFRRRTVGSDILGNGCVRLSMLSLLIN